MCFSFTVEDEMQNEMPDGMSDDATMSEEQEANEMNQQRDKTMTNKKHRAKGIKYCMFNLLCLNECHYGECMLDNNDDCNDDNSDDGMVVT